MPQLIVIVARQRSGTTALAETFSAGSAVQSFGEVFHHMLQGDCKIEAQRLRLHPEAGFFDFKVDQLRNEPDLGYPSVENQTSLFNRYIKHLEAIAGKRWILLDIKYNSWHHFDHYYSSEDAPFLFHLLREKNTAFIHVVRTNSFARYCSEQLALTGWKWHAERGAAEQGTSISISPAEALRDMIATQRRVDAFRRLLTATPRRIELRYEEMYDGENLTAATEISINRLLDGDWDSGTSVPLQKVTPPLKSVIKNRDEVLAYFEPTTFWPEVSTALGY